MATIDTDYNARLYWQFRTAEEAVELGNEYIDSEPDADHYQVINCGNHWALDLYEADGHYIGRF